MVRSVTTGRWYAVDESDAPTEAAAKREFKRMFPIIAKREWRVERISKAP